MNNWIEWTGGHRPVDEETVVWVRLRDGTFEKSEAQNFLFCWYHGEDTQSADSGREIVAYHVAACDTQGQIDELLRIAEMLSAAHIKERQHG